MSTVNNNSNVEFLASHTLKNFGALVGADRLTPLRIKANNTIFVSFGPNRSDVAYVSRKVQGRNMQMEDPIMSEIAITEDDGSIRKAWLLHDGADRATDKVEALDAIML